MTEKLSCDSIIFDMDGTLWDAVDSYCEIWNVTFEQMNIFTEKVSRQALLECMGLPINEIFNRVVNVEVDAKCYLDTLERNERELMPQLGGKLYNGVFEGIKRLASTHKLYMVSNCGADGLKNFLNYTGLRPYFSDTLTHGETHLGKTENIKKICVRNNLLTPIYVGDTQGDCDAAHKAGIPMIYAKYGFGTCCDSDYEVGSFDELMTLFI